MNREEGGEIGQREKSSYDSFSPPVSLPEASGARVVQDGLRGPSEGEAALCL